MTDTGMTPMDMHTDAQPADGSPVDMHTDAGQVMPFDMHTDMVVGGATNGGLHLSAKNSSGKAMSVSITPGMAGRLGTALGLSGPPKADPNAPVPPAPFDMHTDARTKIGCDGPKSKATIDGPADGPDGSVSLRLAITGSALARLKGSHPGL